MALQTNSIKLEFSPEEIAKVLKEQIIKDGLATKEDDIKINYTIQEVGGDYMGRHPGTNTVTKITATITKKNSNG